MIKLSREFRNHDTKVQNIPETTKYFRGFLHTNYQNFYTNFSLIITLITSFGLWKLITIIRIILTINLNNDDDNLWNKL